MSHDDNLRHLRNKFKRSSRYANFGSLIESVQVSGFRGVDSLQLEFTSPILALSGLNGTGKTSLAQLLAAAYRSPSGGWPPRSYVVSWFPVSVVDPRPFTDEAQVRYEYADEDGTQRLTVTRVVDKWSGYKRQPERAVYYVGISYFLPKIEKRDFSVYGGARLQRGQSRAITEVARKQLSFVMGLDYEEANFTAVSIPGKSGELAMVKRGPQRYSENNMGFGEARMFYVISTMEAAAKNSLFILEEPETSLHGEAQRRFAQYLVDVVDRRGHQVVMTTHSRAIMSELGRESVVLLRRETTGSLTATPGLSTYQIDSYLNSGAGTVATICVEDEFAETMVREMLRHFEPDLLSGLGFVNAGDVASLAPAVRVLASAGRRVVAISDTDQTHAGEGAIHALPGDDVPEKVVFKHESVKSYFAQTYGVQVDDTLAGIANHHDYARVLAKETNTSEKIVEMEACRTWAQDSTQGHFDGVIEFIKSVVLDRR
ncbi:MAG: AAA family ATPase [Microcella sp.]|uniref:ATP-dependent nuclease n=1 Tax=Microcella sp. TaxID=1913979 RepID=UPI003315752A